MLSIVEYANKGFRKVDNLIPIITVTVFLSDEKWDGSMDLHEMLDVTLTFHDL